MNLPCTTASAALFTNMIVVNAVPTENKLKTMTLPPKHASEITSDDLEVITEMAAQNKALKDIKNLLHVDARSFMREFRNKESEIYQAYKRGQLQLEITEDDALMQRIADGNVTAIQISENRRREANFKNAIFENFGI